MKIEDLAARFTIERPSRVQPLAQGSYVRVDAAAGLRTPGPLTVAALVWPTYAAQREQCVISRWDETAQGGWALSLGPGGVIARVGTPGGAPITVTTRQALPLRQWQRIWLVADPAAGTLRVGHAPLTGGGREDASAPLPPAARLDAARAAADRRAARARRARALQRQDRGSRCCSPRRRPRRRRWCSIPCSRPRI